MAGLVCKKLHPDPGADCKHFFPTPLSDYMWVAWDQPWWEHLHQGHWQMLFIRAVFPLIVNICQHITDNEGDRQVSAQPEVKWTGLCSPERPDPGSEHFKNPVAFSPEEVC